LWPFVPLADPLADDPKSLTARPSYHPDEPHSKLRAYHLGRREKGKQSACRSATLPSPPVRAVGTRCRCFGSVALDKAKSDCALPAAEPESLVSLHCKPGRAVQIEPILRPLSPENGNISKNCQRLSAFSGRDP
jgi:hypothetical protein